MSETGMPFGARVPMEPIGYKIRYALAGTGESQVLMVKSFVSQSDENLEASVSSDGEVVRVRVKPLSSVVLQSVRVVFRHAFATGEQVLLGGYQSWTDTIEHPAWARMRGLRGVPPAIVKRYSLDGGGDYGIAEYARRRGCQHGFTYATFRRGEGVVLVGSLDESRGFTLIRTDASQGLVSAESEGRERPLPIGEWEEVSAVAVTRGTFDTCYDRWFALMGIVARPVEPLVGYTSWYRHYGAIDEAKLVHDLEGVAKVLVEDGRSPADASKGHADGKEDRRPAHTRTPESGDAADGYRDERGFVRLFQIDDGYCKVGDWLRVDRSAFPHGLAPLAAQAREKGFLPGLWIAPFVCERDSEIFRERPEWLLRDSSGEPVSTGNHWSGGIALDTRNVDVRSYVLEVLQTMTAEWGFSLLKADFLYAACMHPHDGLNRGELMADAIDLLRTGVGENVLILGCGVPLASAFGKVDYCRIGCDVGLDWDDMPHMRLLHRERVSTKNSLANTYGRAPLDGRAFGNDPDVFFLRGNTRLNQQKRDALLFTDAELGSVLVTSDDMGAWGDSERTRFDAALELFLERRA